MKLADAIQKAVALRRAGRPADSASLCRRILEAAPGHPDALQLLGLAHRDQGDVAAAERLLQQASTAAPGRADVLVNLGNLLAAQGRHVEARSRLRKATKLAPELVSAWYHLGLLALNTGNLNEARRCAVRAREIAPDHAPAWELLATVQQREGDVTAAVSSCREGLKHRRGDPRLNYSLGQLLRQDCDFEAAADAYEAALRAGHQAPETFRNLAEVWLEAGEPERALAAADQGIAQFPEHAPLHRIRARMRWELEAPGDPVEALREAARAQPGNHELWRTLAELLDRLERRDEVREVLQEARRRGCPETPELRLLDAVTEARAGNVQAATVMLEALTGECPDDTGIKLAFVQHALSYGEPARAEQLCAEVLALSPLDQLALAYRGTAWQMLGDPREGWLLDYQRMVMQVAVPPPAGFQDTAAFFAALEDELTALHHTRAHPIEQTVRGGTQTNGFLFRLKHPLVRALETQIRYAVTEALATFPHEPHHPFWGRRPADGSVRFVGAWSVRLADAGYHTNHMHPEGWISSALYVGLPEEMRDADDRSGHIQFGVPLLDRDPGLPPQRVIKPEVGTLVLFPSYMWHGTIPFHSQQPRLTVAFDLLPD